jgi:hypothetical protein
MINSSRQKLLFATAFLTILLVFSAYTSLIPIVQATSQTTQDKTISIVNNVLGVNTTAYSTHVISQDDDRYQGLLQSEANFYLMSSQSSVRVRSSFVNNNLRLLYFSDYVGAFTLKQTAANTVHLAKDFLTNYQSYAKDSFYGLLSSTLNDVTGTINSTKSNGNIMLQVLNFNQSIVDYTWTYIDANGIRAHDKNVFLSYEQGQLSFFLNNWPLYKVAGVP